MSPESGQFVAWSPDGRYLLISGHALYVVRPDGTGRLELRADGIDLAARRHPRLALTVAGSRGRGPSSDGASGSGGRWGQPPKAAAQAAAVSAS